MSRGTDERNLTSFSKSKQILKTFFKDQKQKIMYELCVTMAPYIILMRKVINPG